jgi:AraC-type DNA-binding domain-containing proteins
MKYWFQIKRYYAMNFDYYYMEPHMHKEFEIMYVASGCCNIYSWTKEDIREEWKVKEGEYVFVDCFTRHQLEVTKGVHCRILNLEISIHPQDKGICLHQINDLSKSFQEFVKIPTSIYKGYDAEGTLHTVMTELHKQLQNPIDEAENKIQQNLLIAQFLIELARQRSKKYRSDGGSRYVQMALTYLANNFDNDFKITDIAEKIGISTAYLQRLFKEQTGKTLVDKMNELRIEKAKLLLETSRLPITDIAISVGFSNRQHFTYTFRRLTGCSPAIYCKHKGDYVVWEKG